VVVREVVALRLVVGRQEDLAPGLVEPEDRFAAARARLPMSGFARTGLSR